MNGRRLHVLHTLWRVDCDRSALRFTGGMQSGQVSGKQMSQLRVHRGLRDSCQPTASNTIQTRATRWNGRSRKKVPDLAEREATRFPFSHRPIVSFSANDEIP